MNFFDYYEYDNDEFIYDFEEANTSAALNYQRLSILYFNISTPEMYLRAPWADNLVIVDKEYLVPHLLVVRDAEFYGFSDFCDMYVIDTLDRIEFRFLLLYRLLNPTNNTTLGIIVFTEGGCSVSSTQDIYMSSCGSEREAGEMVGVYFEGHRELQRLLTDYNLKGHPLRKDFPMMVVGYVECFYTYHFNLVEFVRPEYARECRLYEFYDNGEDDEINDNLFDYVYTSVEEHELVANQKYGLTKSETHSEERWLVRNSCFSFLGIVLYVALFGLLRWWGKNEERYLDEIKEVEGLEKKMSSELRKCFDRQVWVIDEYYSSEVRYHESRRILTRVLKDKAEFKSKFSVKDRLAGSDDVYRAGLEKIEDSERYAFMEYSEFSEYFNYISTVRTENYKRLMLLFEQALELQERKKKALLRYERSLKELEGAAKRREVSFFFRIKRLIKQYLIIVFSFPGLRLILGWGWTGKNRRRSK